MLLRYRVILDNIPMCILSALLDDIKQSSWAAIKVSYVLTGKWDKKYPTIFVLILLFSHLDWNFTGNLKYLCKSKRLDVPIIEEIMTMLLSLKNRGPLWWHNGTVLLQNLSRKLVAESYEIMINWRISLHTFLLVSVCNVL